MDVWCWYVTPPLPPFSLPGAISVQDSSSLDFEASPQLRLVIQAETAASFGFMAINLNLQDVNDNLPRFQLQNYVAFIWESQSYDSPVIQVRRGTNRDTWPDWSYGMGAAWAWGLHQHTSPASGSPQLNIMWLCRCWQMTWTRE